MPTSRNAKGIDIVAYDDTAIRKITIQVKALSKDVPVPLGSSLDNLFADYIVVCRRVIQNTPQCFVLTPSEIQVLAHRGEKDGNVSYWLQPKDYDVDTFREKWERIQ